MQIVIHKGVMYQVIVQHGRRPIATKPSERKLYTQREIGDWRNGDDQLANKTLVEKLDAAAVADQAGNDRFPVHLRPLTSARPRYSPRNQRMAGRQRGRGEGNRYE